MQYAIRNSEGFYYIRGLKYYTLSTDIKSAQLYPMKDMAYKRCKVMKYWIGKSKGNTNLKVVEVDVAINLEKEETKNE